MAQSSFATEPALTSAAEIHSALTAHRMGATHRETPPPKPEPLLLTASEASKLLGMSVRQFHKLRPRLPAPVVLGPRHVRWRRTDLIGWVAGLHAQTDARPEPPQLRAGKLRRTNCAGGALADSGGSPPETKHWRGSQKSASLSNPENGPGSLAGAQA
jgi:predicted DNA-binding transcriptional regulator AlpA